MTNIRKQEIVSILQSFSGDGLTKNALNLFHVLGYNTDRQNPLSYPNYSEFKAAYINDNPRFSEDKALIQEWKYIDLLFQLSKEEMSRQHSLFDTGRVDNTIIESYLFFAIELSGSQYSRTALSQTIREVNKLFPMPAMILFKHGETLTLSIINRRLHRRDESQDVLEKVTLIKDISIHNPHRAHLEILFDLSFDELLKEHQFTNFVDLQKAWQKTLDTKELNKRFYLELSNWYFWAMKQVSFPDDQEKDENIRNATNLIRLITRVIFIWFIKEKGLVPDEIFNQRELKTILKEFNQNQASCSYYRAILQNLFFGTLNQKVDERGFAIEESFLQNRSEYGVKNLFRYADLFSVSKQDALNLFREVPFLNGGLFDCLDKPDDANKILYVDGFSRKSKKQAAVPDFLFFADDHGIDLNEIYGTKNKKYKVKGLIEILSSYKFTVTENTPIEEEVALDPELLGKVFENLLASYNPETQTTARKQTGSFYTPREIVNYMVDESLKAYLKGVLVEGSLMTEDEARTGLDLLFAYTEKEHLFNETQTQALINAIDKCKILDPACGSGAFPMGVLHKMVHILHKLDPNNEQWKQRQIDKVNKLIEEAQGFTDTATRERVITSLEHNKEDIEDAFGSNELDYGRKLYLIENCIYGVDIQPIAVQIAKLRFFISLVIDQKKQPGKENFGIRALPNLETKFVAANTLIGLDKPRQLSVIKDEKIVELEKELLDLRHRYFSARTRKDKMRYQNQDRHIREQIAERLRINGWDADAARQIVRFDPYDQNASATFFDPQWMFGLYKGFDVVIGNPPYIQIQNFSGKPEQKAWEKQNYTTYTKTGDVYCLFYEQGFKLLAGKGILAYITSNKWMRANYGKVLRSFLVEKTNPVKIIDFENYKVFDSVTVNNNILISEKATNTKTLHAVTIGDDFTETSDITQYFHRKSVILPKLSEESWLISSNVEYEVKKRIEEVGVPLKNWNVAIYRGILTGMNEAFIIDGKVKDELIAQDPKSQEIIKPILLGRDIKRYKFDFSNLWIINTHNGYIDKYGRVIPRINVMKDYPAIWEHLSKINKEKDGKAEDRYDQGNHWTNLRNCAYIEEFSIAKIAWGNLALASQFALVEAGLFINNPSPLITPANRYILAVLNSKIGDYYIRSLGVTRNGGYFEYKPMFVEKLPVCQISSDLQLPFEILVDCILFTKEKNMEREASLFERLVDAMVYELYFSDEIKSANCEVLKHLTHLPELKDNWNDEQKHAAIEKVYKELSDPTHPVSLAMIRMQEVPEVKIIEGRE